MKKIILILLLLLLTGCSKQPSETTETIHIHFTNDFYAFTPMTVDVMPGESLESHYYEPKLPGYEFVGWKTLGGPVLNEETILNETTWLFPVFEEKSFEIQFVTNGDTTIEPVSILHTESLILPDYTPEKEGYDFVGWYFDVELTQNADQVTLLTRDITLYGYWTPKMYKLTFYISESAQITVDFKAGDTVIPYEPLYPLDFIGWVEADSDTLFDFSSMPQRDVVVYMKTDSNSN
ncbi:InlB B-repeat-containing protein [Acholeplasma manati]|uniref:InlB B-repeat-containing protein n=1 Tax=Paracholeplasma manati TaxID=591373 RepID=A0ABT2Y3D7_9MOLU|nr:InlB B-repeat-containing protein [Paracholeplasma manati]MCV2231244.1 InlB B-repeat-containing protein [Paracholeplasma manati]